MHIVLDSARLHSAEDIRRRTHATQTGPRRARARREPVRDPFFLSPLEASPRQCARNCLFPNRLRIPASVQPLVCSAQRSPEKLSETHRKSLRRQMGLLNIYRPLTLT